MCGITGVWTFSPEVIDKGEFVKFTDSLKHRGPDHGACYYHKTQRLALGHRRLSIIDLNPSSNQPFRYKRLPYIICYNGEVFNYLELRNELKSLGYSFDTDSDTEVVLVAFIEWGKECFHKFNGMWAFTIWNEVSEELFICRDRFGIKPLYYTFDNNKHFIFASETVAFKNYSPFKREIDSDNFYRNIHEPNLLEGIGYTIYKNIYQLLPGHYALINKGITKLKQRRWWHTFNQKEKISSVYEKQVESFRELFEDSCLLRLRSDVKIGTALSGGVDSSSVYCMLHNLHSQGKIPKKADGDSWQDAFTATFPGTKQDEKHFAEKVIEYTNGKGNYLVPDYKNLIDDIVSSTKLFDSITGTPIFIVAAVYKAMKQSGITVSLDGHGVDEMMYGYKPNVQEAYFDSVIKTDDEYSKDLLETYGNMFLPEERLGNINKLEQAGKKNKGYENEILNQFFLKKVIKKMYHLFDKSYAAPAIEMSEMFGEKKIQELPHLSDTPYDFSSMSRADQNLALSFHLNDIPYNLRDFDRASMQEAVEIRMPFMDWRMVNYTFSLPLKTKLGHGVTKRILRDSMKGIMPEEIRQRKLKIGLSAPIENWLSNELKTLVLDQFSSQSFLESSHWNGIELNKLFIDKYEKGALEASDFPLLWNVLNAQLVLND